MSAPPDWQDVHHLVTGAPESTSLGFNPITAAIYDGADGFVLLVGPSPPNGQGVSVGISTYSYVAGTYALLTPSLSPPHVGLLTYDTADGYPLMLDTTTDPVTVWNYSGSSWHYIPTASAPSGLPALEAFGWVAQTGYDPANHGVLFIFGLGSYPGVLYSWEYGGGSWTNISSSVTAPTGLAVEEVYNIAEDSGDGYLMMWASSNSTDGQTWKLGLGGWTQVCSNCGPGPALGVAATYDQNDGYMVVFGGFSPPGGDVNTTWSFSRGIWSLLHPVDSPPPSAGAMTYDPKDHYLLLLDAVQAYSSISLTTWWYGVALAPTYSVNVRIFPPELGSVFVGDFPYALRNPVDYGDGGVMHLTNGTYLATPFPSGAICDGSHGRNFSCAGTWSVFLNWSFSGGGQRGSNFTIAGSGGWLNLTFTRIFSVVAHFTGCGPIDFGGTPISNGGSVSFRPSPPSYEVRASICSAYAFQGWASSGGVTVASASLNTTSAALTANGSITAVYSTGGSGPTVGSFYASPNPIALGQSSTITISASGGSGALTYTFSGLPTGCKVDLSPQTVTCTPTIAGDYLVTGKVEDAAGNSATSFLLFAVNPAVVPLPLVVTSLTIAPGTVTVGRAITIAVYATGGEAPLDYVFSGLPPGCLSANRAQWSCVPGASGDYKIAVAVYDSSGQHANATANLVVESTVSHSGIQWPASQTLFGIMAGIGIGAAAVLAVVLFQERRAKRV